MSEIEEIDALVVTMCTDADGVLQDVPKWITDAKYEKCEDCNQYLFLRLWFLTGDGKVCSECM